MAKTQFTKTPQRLSPKRLLGLLVALLVAFLLLTSVVNVAQKYFATRRHIRELMTEQATLQQKQASLATMNDYLNTPEGTEQILRNKYNVIKPGEGIVVVVDPEPTTAVEVSSPGATWWRAILAGLGIHRK